jgi:DNA-binding NarL/FixJ family response regulator
MRSLLMKKRADCVLAVNSTGMAQIIKRYMREVDEREVATAHTVEELDARIRELRPRYLFLENMFVMNATYELVERLSKKDSALRIVVFTVQECTKAEICRFAYYGAHSYVDIREEISVSQEALRRIYTGARAFPSWVKNAMEEFAEDISTRNGRLTRRQREVMRLILSGLSAQDISNVLGISYQTVRNHRDAILKKIDGHCTLDLVKHALSAGIVRVEELVHGIEVYQHEEAFA